MYVLRFPGFPVRGASSRRSYLKSRFWLTGLVLCAGAFFGLGLSRVVAGQNHPGLSLEGVLHHLDAAAKSFHSLSADVERTKVTVVVNDRSVETGNILVRGDKMLMEMKAPNPRTILRTGDNLYVYNPGLKRVEEYNLALHRSLVDQYLLLGFGTSGKELGKVYLATLLGEPMLDEKKTALIELTPKSTEARNQFSKIQIWFDESSWLPIQQQFFETGSGDYFIVRYSKVVRNPDLGDAHFKPHWPKGTQKIRPQG
jgi:outer membrane lipoprotein-sorting protein